MNKLDFRKTVVILLFIIAAFGLSFFSELISFEALKENRSDISDFRDENFILSIILFWLFYFLLVVFSLPGAAVASVSGGFLFGFNLGLLINVTAASTGATVLFILVRYGLKSFKYSRSSDFDNNFAVKIKNGLIQNQVSIMLILRLVPLVPFFLANILPALVSVRSSSAASDVYKRQIPGGIVFTWIGVGVGEVFARNQYPNFKLLFSPMILGPILGLSALILIPMILRHFGLLPRTITEQKNEKY